MSKTVCRITPYGGFDIPGLEGWLAALAGKGLRYAATAGPLTLFERAEPQNVQVHLEPIQGKVEEDPELNAIYEAAGWRYWGMFRGSFFVYASPDLEAKAHTDPEVLDYALKRFFRRKLLGGLLLAFLNALLLGLYQHGSVWETYDVYGLFVLRSYPARVISDGSSIPWLLSFVGLVLIDLAYLLGLFHLARYRRAARTGRRTRGLRGAGWLTAAGLVVLLPVLVNTVQLYFDQGYSPYGLEGSGFVTLTEIEGEGFHTSNLLFYSMDYISHGGTLLDPESWYFQQYGFVPPNKAPSDVPRLEVRAVRYPLEVLAELQVEEWSRVYTNGSQKWKDLGPVEGADQALYAPRKERTHTNEITGETRVFLPGGELILRRGTTVLHADYYGYQDPLDHLDAFVRTLNSL